MKLFKNMAGNFFDVLEKLIRVIFFMRDLVFEIFVDLAETAVSRGMSKIKSKEGKKRIIKKS